MVGEKTTIPHVRDNKFELNASASKAFVQARTLFLSQAGNKFIAGHIPAISEKILPIQVKKTNKFEPTSFTIAAFTR